MSGVKKQQLQLLVNKFKGSRSKTSSIETSSSSKKLISRTKSSPAFMLSEPTGFKQKGHVDMNYKWTGVNPHSTFELIEELGKGYDIFDILTRV